MSEAKDWTVTEVRIGKTKHNPHGGQLQAYYVDFEGAADVYWQRKAGNTPNVGEAYFGTIEDGQYGPRFKQMQKEDGEFTPRPEGKFTAEVTSGGGNNREASIHRQVALKILAPAIIEAGGLNVSLKDSCKEIEAFIAVAGREDEIAAAAAEEVKEKLDAEPVQTTADDDIPFA
jgi:hypothetical protein